MSLNQTHSLYSLEKGGAACIFYIYSSLNNNLNLKCLLGWRRVRVEENSLKCDGFHLQNIVLGPTKFHKNFKTNFSVSGKKENIFNFSINLENNVIFKILLSHL